MGMTLSGTAFFACSDERVAVGMMGQFVVEEV